MGPHYCKHCHLTFLVYVPKTFTGDALIVCPDCGWRHPRQIEAGLAVSCDPPRGKPTTFKALAASDDCRAITGFHDEDPLPLDGPMPKSFPLKGY